MTPERFPSIYDKRVLAKESTLQDDIIRFGDKLWRGSAVEIGKPLTIKAGNLLPVEFRLEPKHLPFEGDVSPELLPNLLPHVRSRYAHIGIDIGDVGQHIYDAVRKDRFPTSDKPLNVSIPVISHCTRPLELEPNAKPFHLFYHSDAAHVRGDELENIVGNGEDKPVHIKGEEGVDWVIIRETTPAGTEQAIGLYLKIDPFEKFWIPPSDAPLRLTEEGSFREVREHLFENVFRKIDDPHCSMPEGALWIGKCPFMRLAHNLYVKLDHDAYAETNGSYEKVGMQTHSPFLEGGRTNHFPHVEIRGPANWVRATVIRNGEIAKPG